MDQPTDSTTAQMIRQKELVRLTEECIRIFLDCLNDGIDMLRMNFAHWKCNILSQE